MRPIKCALYKLICILGNNFLNSNKLAEAVLDTEGYKVVNEDAVAHSQPEGVTALASSYNASTAQASGEPQGKLLIIILMPVQTTIFASISYLFLNNVPYFFFRTKSCLWKIFQQNASNKCITCILCIN